MKDSVYKTCELRMNWAFKEFSHYLALSLKEKVKSFKQAISKLFCNTPQSQTPSYANKGFQTQDHKTVVKAVFSLL